uniref:Uncharacterized protein n=1 Tax=Oryza punctata TaxID=4537 RepID=A0A0E0LDG5_ORYPU
MPPSAPAHLAVLRLLDSGDLAAAARLAAAGAGPSSPSAVSLAAVLLRHPPPRLGYCLHARAARAGLLANRYLANALLAFYVRLPRHLPHALRAFDDLPRRDVVAHSSILAAFLRAGMPRRALASLRAMLTGADDDVSPNAHALSAAVKACAVLRDRNAGACLHGSVLVRGFGDDDVVLSSLVDMYGHVAAPGDARKVFEEMRAPDGICYTSLISAFVRNDWFEEAVRWFRSMLMMKGVRPDGCTFGSMMTALGNLKRGSQGRQAHAQVVGRGLCGNVIVESSTLDMYAKCGLMVEARKVFDRMQVRNEVSQCALLGGYCQNGEYEKVITLFREMDKVDGDWYSLGTVLRACAGLSSVKPGKEIHCRFLRMGGWRDVVVESALVDLYAKCGAVDYAYSVFEASTVRNTITWNAMIGGFAQNGHGEQAINLFKRMVREGPRPDYISFIGVLFACSHTGMVEQGRNYFNSMCEDYGIAPGIEHYNCMVDLLSRVELLEEAEDLINKSPFRNDSSLWAAILGASATHSNPDVAERVAKKMMELEPQYHLSYILLENVYRTVGRWGDALEIRRLMESRKVKKEPGMSWIDANRSKLHVCDGNEEVSELDDLNYHGDGTVRQAVHNYWLLPIRTAGITKCAGLIDLRRATRKFHLPELDEAESNWGSADHKRRWSSLRLYLCGDEISAAAEEDNDDDDDGTVSVKSFETCRMPQEPQAAATVARPANGVDGGDDADGHSEEHGSMSIPVKDTALPTAEPATDSQDEAATMIQSAFRGFMARRQLQKLKCSENGCCTYEPRSPTTASIAASVEVQVGESLSNLRLSDDSAAATAAATSAQHRSSQRSRPQAFRVKEEWDDSTVSSNVSRMRMQSRIEATTRRERALAYAFSQQLRSCGGSGGAGAGAGTTKKRAARSDQAEFNVGWSWLERWMATRQASETSSADDCMSKNAADAGSTAAAGGRRVIVVRRRHDLAGAGEEKESCGSNDVSVVSFDGSSGSLSCYKPGSKSRLRGGGRSLPRRKVASSDHRLHARSHKVSKKVHRRDQEQREEAAAEAYDGNQPPTDY